MSRQRTVTCQRTAQAHTATRGGRTRIPRIAHGARDAAPRNRHSRCLLPRHSRCLLPRHSRCLLPRHSRCLLQRGASLQRPYTLAVPAPTRAALRGLLHPSDRGLTLTLTLNPSP